MRLFIGIFLCSFSAISYEITLTRIFSISLSYHFAFMVVSIAMLGIALSGTILSIYPRLKDLSRLGLYSILLSVSIPLSYLLSNQLPFDPVRLSWEKVAFLYILAYYAVLSIPFFFFGMIMSTAFSLKSKESGLIYGSDLLGAGLGSISAILIMAWAGPAMSVFFFSAISASGVFVIGRKKAGIVLVALNALFIILSPSFMQIRMSPYKGLQLALQYPDGMHMKTYNSGFSQVDTFRSPAVRFAPGLSLKYLDSLPEQIGLSIDGGDITAITRPDSKAGFLNFLPSSLPYELRENADVLIVEPKGGLHVILSRHYSSKNIYKVDSNPLVIDVIRKDLGEFSEGIYDENTYKGLARSYLRASEKTFDIIDISLMSSMPSGVFGIAEDYRFTVEAFREYLSHLKPKGILSLSLFIIPPPRTELRLLNTAIRAIEDEGIRDVENRIACIRSWGSICMLINRSPFSPSEINVIKDFSKARNFDLIYYPGIKEEESNVYVKMPSNEYYKAFKRLIHEDRESFRRDYIFDISEVYDDNPFFNYYLKAKNLIEIYKVMGRKWQYFIDEGGILLVIFIQVVFISIIVISLPLLFSKGSHGLPRNLGGTIAPASLSYFALLGIGFMFVEVPLIQKMILPLEQPSYAVAIVLCSVLIGSGAGSLLSVRYKSLRSTYVLIGLSAVIALLSLLLPYYVLAISAYSLPLKVLLLFLLIMPLSFLMGIPFPLGITTLGSPSEKSSEGHSFLIPFAWAVNGCFSVLSPILSQMTAMTFGFRWVMWLGAGAYAMAFIVLRFIRNQMHP
ncbi:MAG: hypothetical protein HY805_10865 [Nitrospirae bacterium]|nr:hypothetical protein [Nitrospirota bacterium]